MLRAARRVPGLRQIIGTRVTGATRTAPAHDRQRPFGTHLLAAGWAYGESCPWRHSKTQYMQGRISVICGSPTNKSKPQARPRPGREAGAAKDRQRDRNGRCGMLAKGVGILKV